MAPNNTTNLGKLITGNTIINLPAHLLARPPPGRPAHLAGRPSAHPLARLPDQPTHRAARPTVRLATCLPACVATCADGRPTGRPPTFPPTHPISPPDERTRKNTNDDQTDMCERTHHGTLQGTLQGTFEGTLSWIHGKEPKTCSQKCSAMVPVAKIECPRIQKIMSGRLFPDKKTYVQSLFPWH